MKNDRFDAYYKAQKIVPDDEWDKFMDTLREPLPTTFRVAGSRQLRSQSFYTPTFYAYKLPELPMR
jgi:hypothetical protein